MRSIKATLISFSLLIFLFANCSGRFVKRNELEFLKKKYLGTYLITQKVDVGNNNTIKPGAKVRLFFKATSSSVTVYAFRYNEPREQALGKNILFMFEHDFPDEEYKRDLFIKRLDALVLPDSSNKSAKRPKRTKRMKRTKRR